MARDCTHWQSRHGLFIPLFRLHCSTGRHFGYSKPCVQVSGPAAQTKTFQLADRSLLRCTAGTPQGLRKSSSDFWCHNGAQDIRGTSAREYPAPKTNKLIHKTCSLAPHRSPGHP
jgi:hypothetical protein